MRGVTFDTFKKLDVSPTRVGVNPASRSLRNLRNLRHHDLHALCFAVAGWLSPNP